MLATHRDVVHHHSVALATGKAGIINLLVVIALFKQSTGLQLAERKMKRERKRERETLHYNGRIQATEKN